MKRDTRYVIAEQALRIINGGTETPDTEVLQEELIIYVDQAFGKFMKMSYFENKADGQSHVNGGFLYPFTEDVKFDTLRKKYYAKISSAYVSLPSGVGIYSVSPIEDEFNTFVPLNTMFLSQSRGLDVSCLEGRKGYYEEGTRIYLTNLPVDYEASSILIKLVGGIQGEIDPDVNIPIDMQGELVTLTVQLYMNEQNAEKDYINDNNKG